MKNLNVKVEEGLMLDYIGTKKIKAVLTTKREYYDYRGWNVPEDEDPNEEVYLVEYEVDPKSKPNHDSHRGYISMSPKHVFEKAYNLIEDNKEQELSINPSGWDLVDCLKELKFNRPTAEQKKLQEWIDEMSITKDDSECRSTEKTLDNTTADQAKDQVSDHKVWGIPNTWKLISKSSSEKEGWMKSTKALEIEGVGCYLQVTTQQINNTGMPKMYSLEEEEDANASGIPLDYDVQVKASVIAESVTWAPGVKIKEISADSDNGVTARELVAI